ncbi:Fe2+-dicitrate sensor, membrane component [plant metagenome]|uniref:Fe2+-dicitrate sensor, membrane component n=1 Tax=plant metagenome TaxID=1297885 RepID=A0A484V4V0_9ZZZZ
MTARAAAALPPHAAMAQAADWYALLRSSDASSVDRDRWRAWLDAADEHRRAWAYVERIGQRLAPLQDSPDRQAAAAALRTLHDAPPRRRRQVLLGLLGVAGTGLAWSAWRHTSLPQVVAGWTADHHADRGEIRHVRLPDGGEVWLSALSAIDVQYSAQERRLRLRAGEILVQTHADPAGRPFLVETVHGTLRALGTRYLVRLEEDDTLAAVYAGAVEITTADRRKVGLLPAGQQRRFTRDTLGEPGAADPARAAWHQGVLIANGMPLGEVIDALRPYHWGHISLAPEVAALPVFGSYPASDPGRALDMLASVMPLRIRRPMPWWLSVDAQP